MTINTVIRQIEVYDNSTELLVEEIELTEFDLELMKSRFTIKPYDTLMYDPYEIDSITADLFQGVKFDFKNYSYFVTAYQ